MRDPSFDIKKAFKMLTAESDNDKLTREVLGAVLCVDQPHRDILFARFKKHQTSDAVSYSDVSVEMF